jgi:hypothetical protein
MVFSHKKAQKAQMKKEGTQFSWAPSHFSLCAFCAFLWLKFKPAGDLDDAV